MKPDALRAFVDLVYQGVCNVNKVDSFDHELLTHRIGGVHNHDLQVEITVPQRHYYGKEEPSSSIHSWVSHFASSKMWRSIKFHQRWRHHCQITQYRVQWDRSSPFLGASKKLSFWNFSGTNPYFRTTLVQYSTVHFGSVSFFLAAFELIFSMLVLRHRPTQVKMVKSSSVPHHLLPQPVCVWGLPRSLRLPVSQNPAHL